MVACLLLLLSIALTSPAELVDGAGARAASAEVQVERIDVFNEPDDTGFVTSRLDRGDKVVVRKVLPGGWLAIDPPSGSFHWVDDTSVELLRDGRIDVTAPTTPLRLGREGFGRPGPLKTTLTEGAVLVGARQPLLSSTERGRRKVWRAVAAGADEVRFIRSEGIEERTQAAPAPPVPAERRASHDMAELSPEVVASLRDIEERHRSIVAQPVEQWNFATVRKRYQALLARHSDPPSRTAIEERLDELDRGDELAKSAREFEDHVRKSRRRDAVVAQIQRKVRDIHDAEELAYDAEGLLQATSRQVDGERVFSLLNDRGQVVTYLKVPPGLETTNLLAQQVGVRGKSRFNDTLRYRLLIVRDMERLTSDR